MGRNTNKEDNSKFIGSNHKKQHGNKNGKTNYFPIVVDTFYLLTH